MGEGILQARGAETEDLHLDPADDAGGRLGEIIGAPCAAGDRHHAQGGRSADRVQVLPDNWNAPYFGMILKQAPHPAARAARRYMESPEGQANVSATAGAIYPNIPNTFYAKPRVQHVNDFQGEGRCLQRPVGLLFTH
jgi:hypothetical protein